ncbi:MAG: hypothetical protein ACI8TP_003448 [Acidimicrobiales bacterium]
MRRSNVSTLGWALATLLSVQAATLTEPVDWAIPSLYEWSSVTPAAAFAPMDGSAPVVFDGKMWLLGRWGENWEAGSHDQIWSSVDGETWLYQGRAPWDPRHEGGVAVFNDRIWMVGGDNNQGHYQNDVWSSADGLEWEKVADDVPWGGRATHLTTVFDDRLWVMGGQRINALEENPGPKLAFNDVWSRADGET